MRLFEPWSNKASLFLIGIFFSNFSMIAQEADHLVASIEDPGGLSDQHTIAALYGPLPHWADSIVAMTTAWSFSPWNTKLFDPYKDESLEYPFHISFADEKYAAPVAGKMVVTSRYGWRNGMLHRGIDIDLESGDEVRSMLAGKVRYVKSHAGHGKTIVIRHQNGLETIYAHLSRQLVKENDIVEKGQIIGKGGTTGNARGSHLHLEVRYLGRTINPEYFFEFDEAASVRAQSLWVTHEKCDPREYSSFRKPQLEIIHRLEYPEEKPQDETLTVEAPVVEITDEAPAVGSGEKNEVTRPIVRSSVPGDSEEAFYTIQYGDTIYSLARKYKVKIEELCQVNGIADSFKIKVGQKIRVIF
ncbi:MAG: peptidoglycan DD-metalloendopeptidase family protein [Saprospiraceae bacterium]|nr:peptidoglycan DD-metalloendopeptidase family protein [Saprospiraceae bacterium]